MPRKVLDPAIKEVCSKIYESNPVRFRQLINWVKRKQKLEYTDLMITDALKAFEFHMDVTDWWPYLDKILAKLYIIGQQNEAGLYKRMSKTELTKVGNILRTIIDI